jgi:hypothetical protein
MKKILILLFSLLILPVSTNASDIYYCTEDDSIGFYPKEDFRQRDYVLDRFPISIDFKNKNVISENIWMGKDSVKKCIYESIDKTLYCLSDYGTGFSINEKSLEFRKSIIYNKVNQGDDISLSYGTCEKF